MGRAMQAFFSSLAPFARELASFAGLRGLKALLFVFLGVFVEGAGLLLLIPFLTLITGTGPAPGRLQAAAAQLFSLFSAETRLQKLGLLVAIFVALMIVRAFVITVRDVTMMQFGLGFIRHICSRLTSRLANTELIVISRLGHPQISHPHG